MNKTTRKSRQDIYIKKSSITANVLSSSNSTKKIKKETDTSTQWLEELQNEKRTISIIYSRNQIIHITTDYSKKLYKLSNGKKY